MSLENADEFGWVLVEGPGPGAADFLGRWLLAAVRADRTLQKQFRQNPSLREHISSLELVCGVHFVAATRSVEQLMKNSTCFLLPIWGEWGEIFSIMAQIGFFRRTGDRYQMTIPGRLSGSAIEAALLSLAGTEDENFIHPERFVSCLSRSDAQKWVLRLERLPWMQRVADRTMLLEPELVDVVVSGSSE
jgi:hypothetical protein